MALFTPGDVCNFFRPDRVARHNGYMYSVKKSFN